jgi:hypothetical protein
MVFLPALVCLFGGVYGPALQGDSLANTSLNHPGMEVACRFRAAGGELAGIRPFLIWSYARKGYHAGTGGALRLEIQEDDGTTDHHPSGRVLATGSRELALSRSAQGFYPLLGFDRRPVLKAGAFYHVVIANTDPDPAANFLSINAIFTKEATGRVQPLLADEDWAMLWRLSGKAPWERRRTRNTREAFTPILEIDYGDGRSQGVGYVEFWMGAPRPIEGPARVREAFTVTGPDRVVASAAVRVRRISGQGALSLRLARGDGGTLAEAKAPAGDIPATASGSLGGSAWVTAPFPASVRLKAGARYALVLTAPAGTRYEAFPMRKGTDKGFSESTLFSDGHAEFDPGDGWRGWEQWGVPNRFDSDLQFYLR